MLAEWIEAWFDPHRDAPKKTLSFLSTTGGRQPPPGTSRQYHFFLPPAPPSSLRSHEITLPNITTPLPSMKATRERPSQFLKLSQTKGCWGWKLHCAISFDFNEWGSPMYSA